MKEPVNQSEDEPMAKRRGNNAIDWATSIEGAENAVKAIQEIRNGGNAIQEIDASLARARDLQQKHSRRKCQDTS